MERDGWGDAPRHMTRGLPTPLLQYMLYLLQDRMGRIGFVKAEAHKDDLNNNIADKLANEGRELGRVFDIREIVVPAGWIDTAPVLCHQPLDYLTKLVVHSRVPSPMDTIKFGSFLDRWIVMIGTLFGVVLDPGNCIKHVWIITIPEGLREVLWKEMNSAQVLGHRYYGTRTTKSNMGWVCLCGLEMSLGHILLGCGAYNLKPLMSLLLDALGLVSLKSAFRTLHPDEWGSSPWYPLLAMKTLEEVALPISKGRKKVLKALMKSRQKREWIIGTYYWMLWKWRMKEIHDDKFKFVPFLCATSMKEALASPCPATEKVKVDTHTE